MCCSIFLITLQTFRSATLLKRDSNKVFSCEFREIFKKTLILKNICERLLLHFKYNTPVNNTPEAVAKYNKTEKARGRKMYMVKLRSSFFLKV